MVKKFLTVFMLLINLVIFDAFAQEKQIMSNIVLLLLLNGLAMRILKTSSSCVLQY